jgi:drug/metabolite transporter (DMT)-like permease
VIYTGVFSVGVAYTLQAFGQKYSPPSSAAVILSMEAVFAGLFGFMFLDETLTAPLFLGCVLILGAVLLAQKGYIV